MEINNIPLKIKMAQEHNLGVLEDLITQFSPLSKKYAYYLGYEDALFDMQADFIELIMNVKIADFLHKEDKYILSYIKKSMYHIYIKKSKFHCIKINSEIDLCDIKEEQQYYIDVQNSTRDQYPELLLTDLRKILTKNEMQTIYCHYFLQETIEEVALKKHISRQAVNHMKKTALEKLRTQMQK